jgi:hypothetical protein
MKKIWRGRRTRNARSRVSHVIGESGKISGNVTLDGNEGASQADT